MEKTNEETPHEPGGVASMRYGFTDPRDGSVGVQYSFRTQQAAQIDTQWARVEAACRPDLVREGDRAWFALATRTARVNGTDPNCPYWLADLQAASRAFGEAFRTVAEQARRAGVYPGDQRTMRRQWRLDWSGFDR